MTGLFVFSISFICEFIIFVMQDYLQALRAINEPVQEFDINMWFSLVDFITVYSKEDIRVTFKDGTEIQA